MTVRVFVASPLGFAESTRTFTERLLDVLRASGVEPIDPWALSHDLEDELKRAGEIPNREERCDTLHRLSMRIAERNHAALASCDGLLAVLDGVDVDPGTASEIGCAFALGGKIIHGYRGDFRALGEHEGVAVNLQVQYWIERSGGRIVNALEDIRALRFANGTERQAKG